MTTDVQDEERADSLVDTWISRYRRGSLRFFILHLLLYRHRQSLNENSTKPCKHAFHGYMLKHAIKDVTKGKWQPTTASIYPILKELDQEEIITRISETEASQEESTRPIKQYQLTSFGILVAQKLEQARKEFAKAFSMRGMRGHHPPPPMFKQLSKEELAKILNIADLDVLESFQKHIENHIQHDKWILEEIRQEINHKKT